MAARIRELRAQRGWTAQQLAEHCARAGAPQLSEWVLANIETGRRGKDGRRRRDVTVDELLVLAWVLGASPLRLLLPTAAGDEITITPEVRPGPYRALLWCTSRARPRETDPGDWQRANAPLRFYEQIRQEIAAAAHHESRGQTQALQQRLHILANLLNLTVASGLECPPLPPAWITTMRDEGWLTVSGPLPTTDDEHPIDIQDGA